MCSCFRAENQCAACFAHLNGYGKIVARPIRQCQNQHETALTSHPEIDLELNSIFMANFRSSAHACAQAGAKLKDYAIVNTPYEGTVTAVKGIYETTGLLGQEEVQHAGLRPAEGHQGLAGWKEGLVLLRQDVDESHDWSIALIESTGALTVFGWPQALLVLCGCLHTRVTSTHQS